ncbi:hypothetical protein ACQ86I_11015 [Prescottella equi]
MAQQSSAGDVSGGGSPAGRSADRPAPEAMPPPRLSVTVQPREDLYAMLDAVAARDVPDKILISAAAGTGKTVLVADWLARETAAREIAWLVLGPADNDAEELRRRVVGLWERLSSAGRPTVLVLDDAHEVRDDVALGVLASLVDSAPAHSTVVVACRRTPDLPFSRYALDGTLTWIGWEELALGRPEAAAIVEEYGHSLGESDLDALLELTRGWAAPLRLAAIRLSNHTDPSGAIADLVRYPQRISEYVVAETLDALPAYLLRFHRGHQHRRVLRRRSRGTARRGERGQGGVGSREVRCTGRQMFVGCRRGPVWMASPHPRTCPRRNSRSRPPTGGPVAPDRGAVVPRGARAARRPRTPRRAGG